MKSYLLLPYKKEINCIAEIIGIEQWLQALHQETTAFMSLLLLLQGAQNIGVCYGGSGNTKNAPLETEVVDLYKRNNIPRMRIYAPYKEILQALRGSNIELMVGVPNEQLREMASSDSSAASAWTNEHVIPYKDDVKFKYIAVGNEVSLNHFSDFQYILPAMRNIYAALESVGLQNQIKVSTVVFPADLDIPKTYPPWDSVFHSKVLSYMREIISFLVEKRAPLLANVYPFYILFYNQQPDLTPEFALFTSSSVNRFGYQNLFDALVDSFNYALEKEGGSSLEVVVSESGWPSGGNNISTTEYAQTYYPNLILHVNSGRGTPRRPGKPIETYLFEMFDESEKPGNEWDKYFGLFSPDKRPKYQINGFN